MCKIEHCEQCDKTPPHTFYCAVLIMGSAVKLPVCKALHLIISQLPWLNVFLGDRCEQCGKQDSTTYCANEGICSYDNQKPVCICKPGYDSRTNCERKTCEGYCQNNAPCLMIKNNLYCKCPAGFKGPRCEIPIQDCSNVTCLNGGMYYPSLSILPSFC